MKQEIFIKECIKMHGVKYDYSMVNYVNTRTKIKIICPEHGLFEQLSKSHKEGKGCNECLKKNNIQKNLSNFLEKANEIHNNKYTYFGEDYINNKSKIKITCPFHGDFKQRPDNHLNRKSGCPKCVSKKLKYTKKDIIEKFNKKHKHKYNYNYFNVYKGVTSYIKIICPEHGLFEQKIDVHFRSGCPKCDKSYKKNISQFIKKAKIVHNNKYDYSISEYKNSYTKIKIMCPEHGIFKQLPNDHLSGSGCSKCSPNSKLSINELLIKFKNIHKGKYEYNIKEYNNQKDIINVNCPEHGNFDIKLLNHLNGSGCPECYINSKGEDKIIEIFKKNNIEYEYQKKFNSCRNILPLPFDFYIPEKNTLIEYDGIQHFKPVEQFGGEAEYKNRVILDSIKSKWCKDNNIYLIRIPYTEYDNIEGILKKESIIN
jgi:predicted  nucleic acid-binding Zn-ribbon protein